VGIVKEGEASMSSCCEGSWISCINPFNNPIGEHFFFRHIPKCKHSDKNDVAKICPTCWGQALIKNHPEEQAPLPNNSSSWQKHSQAKAGPDLL
jgi:hypothetical protein